MLSGCAQVLIREERDLHSRKQRRMYTNDSRHRLEFLLPDVLCQAGEIITNAVPRI